MPIRACGAGFFPGLRSRCQSGAEFIGLDLHELERCRPFFVCLPGSRYGWVPPPEEVPRELFEEAARRAPPVGTYFQPARSCRRNPPRPPGSHPSIT
jgi:hypothetical protein